VKFTLFFIFIFAQSVTIFSQENPNSNAIQNSMKVRALQEKKAEFHRRTNGESEGYRIKIHFSADKSKAKEVQSKFTTKFADIPSYEEYQQPNFVINVGDFKTKLEAFELLKRIQVEFPYAFIVKSKIRPMKLTE
jgi:hypothetical protein